MAVEALLVINPDKLFEENGIDKIKTVQMQIQNEIEKKREELRTMVGERYRVLLKAADVISDMRDTADNVISCISRTENLCKKLQEKKMQNPKKTRKFFRPPGLDKKSKIIEIKILLSLPEQIWMTIDKKNFLFGAELFLFAKHIYFDVDVSPNGGKIKNEYPVLSKQWEVIANYRNLLISGVHKQLQLIDISYERSGEYLTSIILLEGINYKELLDLYLALRTEKLQQCMHFYSTIRIELQNIALLIHNTLTTIYHCFCSNFGEKCIINAIVNEIMSYDARPTFTKIAQAISLPDHYISPVIKDFQPYVKKKLTYLPSNLLKVKVQNWVTQAEDIVNVGLKMLLSAIGNMKLLRTYIEEDIIQMEYHKEWTLIVNSITEMNGMNIYKHFMENSITKRIIDKFEFTWEITISQLLSSMKTIDEEISKERGKMLENDIRWFVWKENIMDTREYLILKTQGYTARVMKLCSLLEDSMKRLLDETEFFVEGWPIIDIQSQAAQILLSLSRCSSNALRSLTSEMVQSYEKSRASQSESGIIIKARFLQSLITQSPSLEKCLRQGQQQALKELPENDLLNAWTESCTHLNKESMNFWNRWREMTSAKLENLVKTKLPTKISLRTLLESKPLNEVISIEEQTEDGTNVRSDIRIPSQPSFSLQELLFQSCQLLNAIAPHTLPRKTHENLINSFVLNVLECYDEWSRSETVYQSQAWQMLYDVRLITLLLITQKNKSLSESICDTLEKIIDPFDLDVHYPHLQNAVKKSTLRLQGTMGVLIDFREKLPVFNGLKLTQNSSGVKVEEPNIIAMSDRVPWFPLLAVANQSSDVSASKESTPEKIAKPKERGNRKESKSRDFVKSANAFLNAMTSRWS